MRTVYHMYMAMDGFFNKNLLTYVIQSQGNCTEIVRTSTHICVGRTQLIALCHNVKGKLTQARRRNSW